MATKPTKHQPKQNDWKPKGFVNLYLSEGQLKHAFDTFKSAEKVDAAWLNEMANGYRFTFSLDARSSSIVCTVNCKDEASENYGWLLSSFAPTWQEALVLSLYKHLIVLEGHWGDNEGAAPKQQYG